MWDLLARVHTFAACLPSRKAAGACQLAGPLRRARGAQRSPGARRVGGALAGAPVRWAAAGLHFTVAATADGRAFQAGQAGVPADRRAPWEGALAFELVRAAALLPARAGAPSPRARPLLVPATAPRKYWAEHTGFLLHSRQCAECNESWAQHRI